MRPHLLTAALAAGCLWAAVPAEAAPTQVSVRIEGRSHTLFEGPIVTEGHAVSSFKADGGSSSEDLAEHACDGINPADPETTVPGPVPTAAAVDALSVIGETQAMAGQWYPGTSDYFVRQWGGEAENAESEGRSWGLRVNNVLTKVGGCQFVVAAGDEVLWVYDSSPSRPVLALLPTAAHYTEGERPLTANATAGKPFEVEVLAYTHGESSPPAHPSRAGAAPFAKADVSPVSTNEKGFQTVELESAATVITNAEGRASVTFTTPGWHRLKAGTPVDHETGEETAVRSNRLDVCVSAGGEGGCGPAPAEDAVRVPSRYAPPVTGEHPGGGGGSGTPSTESHTSPEGRQGTLGTSESHPAQALTASLLGSRRILLHVPAPGMLTIKLQRRVRAHGSWAWRTVRTIRVAAHRAGALTVTLPPLTPGSYRASITPAGARPLLKPFTVRRR